jgi:4,5-DOPA dioxygenase extradiol
MVALFQIFTIDATEAKKIAEAFDWALEVRDKMQKYILSRDHKPLINSRSQGRSFDLAIPTPEHYLPLIYVMALKEEHEILSIFNDKAIAASLTITSVKIDKA